MVVTDYLQPIYGLSINPLRIICNQFTDYLQPVRGLSVISLQIICNSPAEHRYFLLHRVKTNFI